MNIDLKEVRILMLGERKLKHFFTSNLVLVLSLKQNFLTEIILEAVGKTSLILSLVSEQFIDEVIFIKLNLVTH